jgi:hypothetical protein
MVHEEDTTYPTIDPDSAPGRAEVLIRRAEALHFWLNLQDGGPELIVSWAVELTENGELLMVAEVVTRLHGEDPEFFWRSHVYRVEANSYDESTFLNSPSAEIPANLALALRALEDLLSLRPTPPSDSN